MRTSSTDIITRALGIADLVNATNITYNDMVRSLNESYKDIYTLAMNSDDDYFVTEEVIPILGSYINPTSIGQVIEYLVPVPSDLSKVRYIDYQFGTQWQSMLKYPISAKNFSPSEPMYRWKGARLSIIGPNVGSQLSAIRLGYYPEPATLSLPGNGLNIGAALSVASQAALVTPDFTATYVGANINAANGSLGRVVYYDGASIICEDEDIGTTTTLFTGVGITQVKYYAGFIYFLQSGSVYGFRTDLISVGTPVLVVTPAVAPTEFSILTTTTRNTPVNYNPPYLLWMSDNATTSYIYTTAGALVSTTAQGYRDFFTCGGYFFAVDLTGSIYRFDSTVFASASGTLVYSGVQDAWSDGTYIYFTLPYLTELHKLTLDVDVLTVIANDVIASDINVNTLWNVDNGMATYQQVDGSYTSISLDEDTVISYPNNFITDLLSYQCAIDFISKQHGDPSGPMERKTELLNTYRGSLRRDDYQPERIGNVYAGTPFRTGW